MAHFAEIGLNNIVVRVIVVSNQELLDEYGVYQEQRGIDFCRGLFGGGRWIQTSYNNTFRKNFAGEGYTYDTDLDAFIPPKPFDSWILNEETCSFEPPVAYPNDGNLYTWNEEQVTWLPAY